jgi:putative acetyltransferase
MAVVRPEQPADVVAIHAIQAVTFPTDLEARLVFLLRAARHLAVPVVAKVFGAVVGHVAFSPV